MKYRFLSLLFACALILTSSAVFADYIADVDVTITRTENNTNLVVSNLTTPCPNGYVLTGTPAGFDCVPFDVFVNESGDTMTGDLQMGHNNIYSVASLNASNVSTVNLTWNGTATGTKLVLANLNATEGMFQRVYIDDDLVVRSNVGSALTPTVNNNFNLGTGALKWNEIYASGANIIASGVMPTDTARDLGSAALEWANVYVGNGKIYLRDDQDESFSSDGSRIIFNIGGNDEYRFGTDADGFFPVGADDTDLGLATNEWNNFYLGTGRAYFYTDQGESIYSDGTYLKFFVNNNEELKLSPTELYPPTSGGLNLGAIGAEFANLYLGAGKAYFYTDQGEHMYSSGVAMLWGVSTIDEMGLTAEQLYPVTNAGLDLGTDANEWKDIWIDGTGYFDAITMQGNLQAENIYPNTADTYNLGAASAEWSDLYLNDSIYFGSIQTNRIHTAGTTMYFTTDGASKATLTTGAFTGASADARDLGTVATEWNDLFIGTGKAYFYTDQQEYVYSDGSNLFLGSGGSNRWKISSTGRLEPATADTYNIGSPTGEVANMYLGSGKLHMYIDQNSWMDADANNIEWGVGGVARLGLWATALNPLTVDTISLGGASEEWQNLYLGDVGKIYLGLGQDVNLYRGGANVLKTDDTFSVPTITHSDLDINGLRSLKSPSGLDALLQDDSGTTIARWGDENPNMFVIAKNTSISGNLTTTSLVGTYANGEAYVCVDNNGDLFAKDTACS